MAVEHPLILQDFTVAPSDEWSPQHEGWTVLRVSEGFGYCLHKKGACELQAGDGFMAPQTTSVKVRASQLGALRLHCFRIQPELLAGLLTVTESQQLRTLSADSSCISIFKGDEPNGQEFSRLLEKPPGNKLAMRCALLRLWADGLACLFDKPVSDDFTGRNLRERFHELVEQLPESKLLELTLAELARQVHCSERHLERLFREKFGVSLRSQQVELRLQQACRLLADSRIKIASIAAESGYQNLGLFNAMFKKRFGMTPSEWRRNLTDTAHAAPVHN